MNKLIKLSALGLFIVTVGVAVVTGCGSTGHLNTGTDSTGAITGSAGLSNDNTDVTINGTFDPATEEWSANAAITITFRSNPPADLTEALFAAGATPAGNRSVPEFVFKPFNRHNPKQLDALARSLEAGATVAGWNP